MHRTNTRALDSDNEDYKRHEHEEFEEAIDEAFTRRIRALTQTGELTALRLPQHRADHRERQPGDPCDLLEVHAVALSGEDRLAEGRLRPDVLGAGRKQCLAMLIGQRDRV
jgi:hypothetical protein